MRLAKKYTYLNIYTPVSARAQETFTGGHGLPNIYWGGGSTIYIIYNGRDWGAGLPPELLFPFLATQASSPSGSHVRGESSQLSLAYVHMS